MDGEGAVGWGHAPQRPGHVVEVGSAAQWPLGCSVAIKAMSDCLLEPLGGWTAGVPWGKNPGGGAASRNGFLTYGPSAHWGHELRSCSLLRRENQA